MSFGYSEQLHVPPRSSPHECGRVAPKRPSHKRHVRLEPPPGHSRSWRVSLLTSATTYADVIRSLTAFDRLDWMFDRLGLSRVNSGHSGLVKKGPIRFRSTWFGQGRLGLSWFKRLSQFIPYRLAQLNPTGSLKWVGSCHGFGPSQSTSIHCIRVGTVHASKYVQMQF